MDFYNQTYTCAEVLQTLLDVNDNSDAESDSFEEKEFQDENIVYEETDESAESDVCSVVAEEKDGTEWKRVPANAYRKGKFFQDNVFK